MKLKFILFLLLISGILTNAQNEYITIWKPSNPSTPSLTSGVISNSNQILFPGSGTNFNVSWEEIGFPAHTGNINSITSTQAFLLDFGSAHNPVATNATYKVKISDGSGSFNQVKFKNTSGDLGDLKKILKIEQWGNIVWTDMEDAYSSCSNLDVTATDSPNLQNVTHFSRIFSGCTSLVGNASFNNWDTSNVTDMQFAFGNCFLFNQSIASWNTANVTAMSGMFTLASTFNQPLANWDTSKVVHFVAMFLGATNFNQPIGNWNTSSAIELELMFSNAKKFNQPIGNWNTSNTWDFKNMFRGATDFNQPLGAWNTGAGTEFTGMFQSATSFNQDLDNWNTANALLMDFMFSNALSFNKEIQGWDTSKVTTIASMFQNTPLFNSNIGNWNTSSLIFMQNAFNNATSFNQNISGWNTMNVQNMTSTFHGASVFNQNLGPWNIPSLVLGNNIFLNSAIDCQNYDNILYAWGNRTNTPNNVTIASAAPLIYSNEAAVAARSRLINSKGWIINGDTYNAACSSTILNTSESILYADLSIFPNPASDFLHIKSKLKIAQVIIIDISGRLVLKINNPSDKIKIANLQPGNYVVQIKTEEGFKSFKIIKK